MSAPGPHRPPETEQKRKKWKTYFGEENRVDFWAVLEVLQNAHALDLACAAVNVQLSELLLFT